MMCSACSWLFYTSPQPCSSWAVFLVSVGSLTINPSPPLAFLTISPLKGVLGLCDLPGKGLVGVSGEGEGELFVVVLERWFGHKTVGKGRYKVGGKG
ncbi:hypothetical protein Tco_0569289 [Tanacetum coccineum]